MGFSPFVTHKDFFQKYGSVNFVPLSCPNFMQKLEKTNALKTDQRTDVLTDQGTDHGQG